MIRPYSLFKLYQIRLYILYNLIFFVITLLSCQNQSTKSIRIEWVAKKPVGILIPRSLINNTEPDSIKKLLEVRLSGPDNAIAMLGTIKVSDEIIFEPLIPLSEGLSYKVFYKDLLLGEVNVPALSEDDMPVITAIYPSGDTVPENLLKIYIQFSAPMREGESLKHISLIKDRDTLKGIFLDLQPELWNEGRTTLTLWLDPGRIKRDLIPNRLLGTPLKEKNRYTMVIADSWTNTQGLKLKRKFIKKFVVASRDSIGTEPGRWQISTPLSGTKNALSITFNEALDYFLLLESIKIRDSDNKPVKGRIVIDQHEKRLLFYPAWKWVRGTYVLHIDPKLEDMAGNNLKRPFDRDLKQKPQRPAREKRSFKIN